MTRDVSTGLARYTLPSHATRLKRTIVWLLSLGVDSTLKTQKDSMWVCVSEWYEWRVGALALALSLPLSVPCCCCCCCCDHIRVCDDCGDGHAAARRIRRIGTIGQHNNKSTQVAHRRPDTNKHNCNNRSGGWTVCHASAAQRSAESSGVECTHRHGES